MVQTCRGVRYGELYFKVPGRRSNNDFRITFNFRTDCYGHSFLRPISNRVYYVFLELVGTG